MYCIHCGAPMADGDRFCRSCGQPVSPGPIPPAPSFKMGWYKFLIYFALFASFLLNFIGGLSQLLGLHYNGAADAVYQAYPAMRPLDILYGLGQVALAVLCLVTRFSLARFKCRGPKLLYLVYGLNLLLSLLYVVAASAITAINLWDASIISSLTVSAVMLAINISYFNKRRSLFVR